MRIRVYVKEADLMKAILSKNKESGSKTYISLDCMLKPFVAYSLELSVDVASLREGQTTKLIVDYVL